MGGSACTVPRARPPLSWDARRIWGRGAPQGFSPGCCKPPATGGTAASCARRRRRNLSAPVTVMGWSGRNPARPARRGAEPRRAAPGPQPSSPPPAARLAPTQELLGGPGELRAAAQPVAQPLQVEPRHLLAAGVGQRVEAAELLQVLPVPGAPAVRRHDAEEGPVGAAAEGETDHDVPAPIALQEAATCGESAGRLRAGPRPAGRARGHSPSCTMAAAGPSPRSRRDGARGGPAPGRRAAAGDSLAGVSASFSAGPGFLSPAAGESRR